MRISQLTLTAICIFTRKQEARDTDQQKPKASFSVQHHAATLRRNVQCAQLLSCSHVSARALMPPPAACQRHRRCVHVPVPDAAGRDPRPRGLRCTLSRCSPGLCSIYAICLASCSLQPLGWLGSLPRSVHCHQSCSLSLPPHTHARETHVAPHQKDISHPSHLILPRPARPTRKLNGIWVGASPLQSKLRLTLTPWRGWCGGLPFWWRGKPCGLPLLAAGHMACHMTCLVEPASPVCSPPLPPPHSSPAYPRSHA
jgi:hypothetical protein